MVVCVCQHISNWDVEVKLYTNELLCCREYYSKVCLRSTEMLSRCSYWSSTASQGPFLQCFSSPVSDGYVPWTAGKWVWSDHWWHKNSQRDCRLGHISDIAWITSHALVTAVTSWEHGWTWKMLIVYCWQKRSFTTHIAVRNLTYANSIMDTQHSIFAGRKNCYCKANYRSWWRIGCSQCEVTAGQDEGLLGDFAHWTTL